MPRVRNVRPLPWLLGPAFVCGPLLVGCGADTETKTVIPAETPAAKGKDSMDYYHNQMKNRGKGAVRK